MKKCTFFLGHSVYNRFTVNVCCNVVQLHPMACMNHCRWTKANIKSYRRNRPLHSYCAECTYR